MKIRLAPILAHPWLAAAIVMGLTIASIIPIKTGFRMETNLDSYMPENHPAFSFSDEAEERFQIKDGILIALEHPVSIFNTGSLKKMVDIESELRSIPELRDTRIQSLHTGDNILGTEEGLDVRPFFTDPPETEEEAFRIGELAYSNPMIRGRLISEDGRSALIVVELPDSGFSKELYQQVTDLAAAYEGPENVYVAGRPIVEGTLAELGPKDMARMGPLVLIAIALVLLLILKKFSRVLTTLFIVVASTLWSFALMSLLGIPLYSVSIMLPVMLVAIGVAYAIHLYGQVDQHRKDHPEEQAAQAIEQAALVIGPPSLYAALTTVAGFIALLTSSVYPVKYFGLFTAFGVAVSWLLTMTLAPAMLMIMERKTKPRTAADATNEPERLGKTERFGERFADGVSRNRFAVYAATAVVIALSLVGVSRVWINSSFLSNFEKDSAIVKTDSFVNRYFGGTSTVNIILDSNEYDAFKNPDVLRLMDSMQESVESRAMVGDSFSLATYLKQMNYAMNAEREEFRNIPDSAELTAQYLLLYEMSGDPDNLWKVVDPDFMSANVTVQLKSDDSRTIGEALEAVEPFRAQFGEYGIAVNFAGSGYKALVFSDLILSGQLSSLLLSVAIVFLLTTVLFRSIVLGAISTIPVLISMAVNFGIMGLLNVPLTTSTALISSIAVGIGVDYAIHFISHYRQRLRDTGDETDAARYSMSLTGKAVLLNAVTVISGFMVMVFSVFPPNRQVGLLVSLNMLVAFISTVTIMFLVLRKSSRSL